MIKTIANIQLYGMNRLGVLGLDTTPAVRARKTRSGFSLDLKVDEMGCNAWYIMERGVTLCLRGMPEHCMRTEEEEYIMT